MAIDLERLAVMAYEAGPLEPWERGRKLANLPSKNYKPKREGRPGRPNKRIYSSDGRSWENGYRCGRSLGVARPTIIAVIKRGNAIGRRGPKGIILPVRISYDPFPSVDYADHNLRRGHIA